MEEIPVMSSAQVRQTSNTYRKLANILCGAMLILFLSALPAQARRGSATEVNAVCGHQGNVSLPPTPAWSDIAGWSQPQYYATIQLADIDGDGRAELIGRGPGGILVNYFDTETESWVGKRAGPPLNDAARWDQPRYYTTIRFADIDGNGQAELVVRGAGGIEVWRYDPHADNWKELASGGPFSDNSSDGTHWNQPQYYTTIHLADLDGDGRAELVARGSDGLHAYLYEERTHSWLELPLISDLSDANGWDQAKYYSTIRLADVDGRGEAEVIARGPDGIHVYRYEKAGGSWGSLARLTELSDANGWDQPQFGSTIRLADIDGRPGAELIARGPDGFHVYSYNNKTGNWTSLRAPTELSDGSDEAIHADAIQLADVDGHPGAELILRVKDGIRIWHYNPTGGNWTRLGTMNADIPSMSDANGWNVPQNYLTIQAADVDGRPGAELIGRSSIGIETWRFTGGRATQATGTPNFPPFTGVQSTYYKYLSPQLGPYGTDIRADYDEIPSDDIPTILDTKLPNAAPPKGVSPTDPAWLAVKTQIGTELSYVQVATDWVLGPESTRVLIQQIFMDTGLNANAVAAKLSDVSQSDKIAAALFSLLTKIAQGVASTAGVPVAPGIASLLNTLFPNSTEMAALPT